MSDSQDIPAGAALLARQSGKTDKGLVKAVKQAGLLLPEERICTAKVKLRERGGKEYRRDEQGNVLTRPCRNRAIIGGFVCWHHGGKAPQVRAKAERRLLAMVEPSIMRLEELAQQNEHLPTALAAVRTVLERAGDAAIGALSKQAPEADTRPIINIGIAVGGIAPKPDVKVGLLPAAKDGELVGND